LIHWQTKFAGANSELLRDPDGHAILLAGPEKNLSTLE
jgi:hypothetical protein